jgi:hypothetical protein
MPFLYDRDASDDVAKPKGRRMFNKSGREPLDEAKVFVESNAKTFHF